MTVREAKALAKRASSLGFILTDGAERGTVLRQLGFDIQNIQDIMDLHGLMLSEELQVWPYELTTTYVDPSLQVARVKIHYKSMYVDLEWWLDLVSVREAGLSPLMLPNGGVVDMAFLCAEQAQEMYNAMFKVPVNGQWPELDYHIKYVFDTLYHVKHNVPRTDGNEDHWINSIEMAEVWMEHFLKLGYAKMQKVLDTERYQQWCDSMVWIETNKAEVQKNHKLTEAKAKAKSLAAKL